MGEESFQLGEKVRDRISGFEGTITGIWTRLHGPQSYELSASGLDPKGRSRVEWFDQGRLMRCGGDNG